MRFSGSDSEWFALSNGRAIEPPETEHGGVNDGSGIVSDGKAEILVCWFTVSLAAGNDTASKAAMAIGAL